jgi:methionyl-tRNA formyltransferase
MRIVFMGTPEFATTILQAIQEDTNHELVGVVTTTDKPAGRGQKLRESHVKQFALEQGLTILQPEKLKHPDFIHELESLNADLFVVVAFRMLPNEVWSIPSKGTINLHGSLLPKYRGAAPINWAVIYGEKKTGVTTFYINENIDTGDVILQKELNIHENETAGEVHDRMMHLGAETVLETIHLIEKNNAQRVPQLKMNRNPTPAPKIFKNDCEIKFTQPATVLHNFIRGMSPFPGAWLKIQNVEKNDVKIFKIFRTQNPKENSSTKETPQLIEQDKELYLTWKNNSLQLLEVQLEGKRKMETSHFLQGFKSSEWKILH